LFLNKNINLIGWEANPTPVSLPTAYDFQTSHTKIPDFQTSPHPTSHFSIPSYLQRTKHQETAYLFPNQVPRNLGYSKEMNSLCLGPVFEITTLALSFNFF